MWRGAVREWRWRQLAIAAAGMVMVAACGGGAAGGTGSTAATGPAIKIGVLADQAPLTAVEGAEMRVNTDLAIAQVNASGGIHGHRLEAVYADPKAAPDEAVTLAQQ